MNIHEIVLAHELDAAWIIALWKAIHGGDPAPEKVAAQVIAALVPYLNASADTLTFQKLEKQFGNLGVKVTESETREAVEGNRYRPHQYCFKFEGQTICIELPRLQNLAVAA